MLAVDRMKDFAFLSAPQQQSTILKLIASFRWMLCVIVVGLALEFCAAVSQVVFFIKIQNSKDNVDLDADSAAARENMISSFKFAQTLQYCAEISVLCILIFILMVLCVICIHVIRSNRALFVPNAIVLRSFHTSFDGSAGRPLVWWRNEASTAMVWSSRAGNCNWHARGHARGNCVNRNAIGCCVS